MSPAGAGRFPEETDRALTTKIGLDKERARRRLTLTAMQHAFPEAEVVGFEVLIEGLGCHPKDRHVLAAAFASDADVILTFNLSDFPDNACEPHGVVAVHPEQYLLELLATDREATLQAIVEDASRRTSPPLSPSEFLARLAATVPTFANMAHQAFQEDGPFSGIPAYVVADPADSPLAALAESGDLTDPLQVAALWWLALLHRDEYAEQLRWLTHAPEAWGDFDGPPTCCPRSPLPPRSITRWITLRTSRSSGSSPRLPTPPRLPPRSLSGA